MTIRAVGLAAVALCLVVGGAAAQVRTTVRAQAVYESYSFDPGFNFEKVSEFSVPVGVDLSIGRRLDVTLSAGYVSLEVTPKADYERVSGMLDTQLRFGIKLIPGHLTAIIAGAVPTGVKVDSAQASVLTPIASDVIGFAIPTLGMGGSLGGGLVGAVSAGRFAIGMGATYHYPFSYQPFQNSTTELVPGSELRGRLGIEGPLARTTYMRFAGVYAARSKDQFGGVTQSGVGNRLIGYGEVIQGIGRMQLTLYAFDVYRGSPSIEGPAVLPKGNLIAAGFRHAVPVTRTLSLAPRVEWRMSTAAVETTGPIGATPTFGSLQKAGSSFRIGMDVRQAFSPGVSLGVYGSGLFGDVRPEGGADVPINGWRAGILFTVTR
ncbi:MAG: hypothetical protein OEY20_04120 [Gemmatimonadota bacterium]|nr:hypothetical protein [Gemmatimonadota bacterium]MDH5196414.1 hypothetical protein [Gemmatimonadota bacterium]